MITAVETNVLLDILVPNKQFYEASALTREAHFLVACRSVTITMSGRVRVMLFSAKPLTISSDEQDELREMSLSRSLPAAGVFGASGYLVVSGARSRPPQWK